MSGILLFGLDMVVQFSSPRNWGLKVPRICIYKRSFGFSIKRKMDNTKEIAKTYQGLSSNYCALKTIHDKSIGTFVRPTLVSMQRGLFEARNSVLNWAPICLTAISPLSPPEACSRTCPTHPLSHRPMTIRSCKKL
jgi:hypothetical protein